ncbi:MAG: hypothetical protein AAFP98_11780 [Pseudomonadota bacterium]
MRNIHPADELAMIRTDMRRLKEREAFLRNGFLAMRLPTRGEETIAPKPSFLENLDGRNRFFSAGW